MADQAERLRRARESAGYKSAIDAARAFGWKDPTYYSHENGSRGLTMTTANRYGRAFRVSPIWLLTGEGAPGDRINGRPPKYDREMLVAAIESLLQAIVPQMDAQEAAAFSEAVLGLVELHQRRSHSDDNLDKLRKAIASTADLIAPRDSR
jgi:DNA-binding XRE family transcriptional regulator